MLSDATLPVYPGLGQATNNAGLHTQWLGHATNTAHFCLTTWIYGELDPPGTR